MPNLIRFIVLIAIVWLVYRLIKQWRAQSRNLKKKTDERIENIVKCAQCGVHIPENEAIHYNDQVFCSSAHKDEYIASQG